MIPIAILFSPILEKAPAKNASYYLSLSLVISDFTLEFDEWFAGSSFRVIKSGWLV